MYQWNDFYTDCLTRGLGRDTLKTYGNYIIPFIASGVKTKMELYEYLNERYKNPYTRKKCWEHLRTFLKWHGDTWQIGFRIICPLPEPPPVLTREDATKILLAIPGTRKGIRDRALFAIYFTTGARRNSIIKLERNDLDMEGRWMYLRKMKGGKQVSKPIPQAAADYLAEWLAVAPESKWVFPSLRFPDRHLHEDAITHYIPKYAILAGFPENRRIYTHLLRHSFATELDRSGQPAEVIMQCLDHSDIRMSLHYVRRSVFRVRQVTDLVFGKI